MDFLIETRDIANGPVAVKYHPPCSKSDQVDATKEPVGVSCLPADDEDDPVVRKNEAVAPGNRAVDGWSNPVAIISNSVDSLEAAVVDFFAARTAICPSTWYKFLLVMTRPDGLIGASSKWTEA